MSIIADNIGRLLDELPKGVTVVAVTKTRSPGEVMEAYNAGLRILGENRVQELAAKKSLMPDDILWHLIGHLQSNKVRQAVAGASVIESVDTVRLLQLIDTEAHARGKIIDCLLQIHIATEETKSGFTVSEATGTDWSLIASSLNAVRICGVMGIATFTDNMQKVRSEFRTLASVFRQVREDHFRDKTFFREISMGMSGDWRVAVEEGSTMIRIGTLIFGERNKNTR
jgi:pyridoxal phosphate enzyme (YggS family)